MLIVISHESIRIFLWGYFDILLLYEVWKKLKIITQDVIVL